MIAYINDPAHSTRNFYSWKTLFNKVTGYKIAHKSVAFLYTNEYRLRKKSVEPL